MIGIDIAEHVKAKSPNNNRCYWIAIDGHGGSGKSTLSKLLSEALHAEVIHQDDFASMDNPINWWPLVIEKVFRPVAEGKKTLSYPRGKWWDSHDPKPVVNQPITKIMILEGVSSLRKEFRDYIDYGIFVDAPKDVCLTRGFERDKGTDGKTDQEIQSMWRQWYKEEEEYIERDHPQEIADIVVDGTRPFGEQIVLR